MHSAKHSFRWAGAHRCVPIALAPTFASWRLCSDAMVWRCLKGIAHDLSARLRSPDVVSYITASPRLSQTSPGNDSDLLYYILCQYVYIIYIYINIYVYICIYTHYTTMQCSTIPYTTLHYITYIHVFIFTHVCHLTTKPTVQRTIHDRLKNEDKRRQDKNTVHIKDQTSAAQPQHKFFRFYHFYGLYTYDVQTHWSWSQHILESFDW